VRKILGLFAALALVLPLASAGVSAKEFEEMSEEELKDMTKETVRVSVRIAPGPVEYVWFKVSPFVIDFGTITCPGETDPEDLTVENKSVGDISIDVKAKLTSSPDFFEECLYLNDTTIGTGIDDIVEDLAKGDTETIEVYFKSDTGRPLGHHRGKVVFTAEKH
jgi:hypothetical protein